IHVRGYAIDLVVRGHHRLRVAAFHGSAERRKEHLAQNAFRDVGRPDVAAALGLAVSGHVLERREHAIFSERQRTSLKTAHGCDTELADQVGIFAVSLLEAAPARVTSDVDDGSEYQLHAARA